MSRKKLSVFQMQLIVYMGTFIGYLLFLILYNNLDNSIDYTSIIFILSWIGVMLYVGILFSWNRITGEVFTPYIIFMSFFFLFNYGQPIMWAFGIHTETEIGITPIYPGYDIASSYDIVKTQLLVLTSAMMFHLGAILTTFFRRKTLISKDNNIIKGNLYSINATQTLNVMFYLCFIINIVVTPITLYLLFKDIQIARTYGYSALYYSEHARGGFSFLGISTIFFLPSLIGILLGSRGNTKIRFYVYSVFALYLLLNVSIGERGTWVFKLLIFIWVVHKVYKKIDFKYVLKILPIGIAGLYLLNAVVSLRNKGISIENILQALSIKNSPIIDAFFEMGSSMNPTLYLVKYGWDIWPYPNSYFSAIGGIFTNRLLNILGIQWDVVNNFFKDFLDISWGPAFSIVAEPLMNYGPILTPLIMLIIGFIITNIIYIDQNTKYYKNPLRIFFVATSLDVLIHLNRNDLHVPIKNWVYGVVFITLIILIMKKVIYRK